MDATVVFWDLEKLWMELTDVAKLMTIATVLQIASFTLNTLCLTFGSATEENLCVVRSCFFVD